MARRIPTWYKFDRELFAIKVLNFREGRGVSLRSFAKHMKVSASMQSRIETLKVEPPIAYVLMFCVMDNLNPDELLIVSKPELVSIQKELI